ncbi:cytoskeletal protein RodZ [Cereibacter ovatus]|uniref:Cytoskeletal protein RodZ n=1 Tax=Cereibacter ovatus TaxID=439529 RepID=A0A285CSA9_9RHOB|nr:helix-turn-helix domain-containing protein [Cereibacter ovatus]SNX70384.1 cytoskeletal protein RodZ [Cereibacter ovatus]
MIWRRTQPSTAEVDKPKGFDDFEIRLGDLMRGERATLGKSLLDVQRELKIKATYIAAIENADVSAFETQGFIAGYVRSYARYLGMDPDEAFRRFCVEANFTTMHGMEVSVSSVRRDSPGRPASELRDPFADPNALFIPRGESFLNNIEPGAVGSVAVLLALIGGIGYGGWSVLQQVQRVQVAPVDQAPRVVAEIDPLGNVTGVAPLVRSAPASTELELAEADPAQHPDLMGRLYRPQAQALDVPVLVSRDGPIAAIDPRRPEGVQQASLQMESAAPSAAEVVEAAVQVAEAAPPSLELLAVRPSWVRVQAADGTVLFEKILNAGERYSVPQMEQAPLLRAGNSGSVYFAVNGQTYGPAAPGAQVVKNVPLSPEALTGKYAVADLSRDTDLARYTTVAQNDTN